MPEDFQIRRAGPRDIPVLLDLMRDFHAESGHALDRAAAGASFGALLDDDARGAVWLAEVSGAAIGHSVLTLRHAMEFDGLAGHIDDLYVAPNHRGHGVASALLAALRAECRGRGVRALLVEAGRDNDAALAVYRRLGLEEAEGNRVLLEGRLS